MIDPPEAPAAAQTDFETFRQLDIRVGTVREAAHLDGARKPAYKLLIDFGEGVGTKASSAQVTARYTPEELVGRQVLGVVNFPPRRVAGFKSEVLTLGVADAEGAIVLIAPDAPAPDGARLA